ncbi:MAG: dihydrolipoamide acetyltransferase family protein [Candidatus Sericytochromatia bacterium]
MIEVKLPDIGEGIAEGEIIKWNVQPGDRVEADQPLVDILTDKAQVEIPSPVAGVVDKLLFAEGDLAPVGQVIVHLRSGDAAATTPPPVPAQVDAQPVTAQEAQTDVAAPVASVPAASADVMATPAIRRQARSQGVDLSTLTGSGPYGRILSEDVEKAAAAGAAAPVAQPTAPAAPVAAAPTAEQASEERIPLRGIRRKIAEQMVKAKFTAPDFLFADEADVTELVAFRKEMAAELKAEGIKLTYLPFVVKAVVSALKAYPTLNASLDDERQEIVLKKHYHIGIATASPNGLFVPVIRHADRKSVLELAVEIERLAAAVREGKASAEDMRGGTFTITNIGAIGGLLSAPIINHPEVAIMGLNKIYQKPMVYRDEIAIRWACNLSLSFDHRVVDGSDGAYFTRQIIRLLENPRRLLLET